MSTSKEPEECEKGACECLKEALGAKEPEEEWIRCGGKCVCCDLASAVISQAKSQGAREALELAVKEVATTFAKSPLCKRMDSDADRFYLDVLSILQSNLNKVENK